MEPSDKTKYTSVYKTSPGRYEVFHDNSREEYFDNHKGREKVGFKRIAVYEENNMRTFNALSNHVREKQKEGKKIKLTKRDLDDIIKKRLG